MLATYDVLLLLSQILIYGKFILSIPQVWVALDSTQTSQICTTQLAAVSLEGPVPTVTGMEILTSTNVVVETVTPTITRMTDVPMVIRQTPRLGMITVPQMTRTVNEFTTESAIETMPVVAATTAEFVGDRKWSRNSITTITETIPTRSGFMRPTPAPFGMFKREKTGPQRSNAQVLEDVDTPLDESVPGENNLKLHKRVPVPARVICTVFVNVVEKSTIAIMGTSTASVGRPSPGHTLFAGIVRSTVMPPNAPPDALVTATPTITEKALTTTFAIERTGAQCSTKQMRFSSS